MSALGRLLIRARNRSLELLVLQFFVVVILPNNAVGTPDLPAVGAKKVIGAQGRRLAQPAQGKPPARIARGCRLRSRLRGRPTTAVCQAVLPHPAASQLSQHLRI